MVNLLSALIAAIPVAYLIHVGYQYILKRQRLDWASERKLLNESAREGCQIGVRVMRRYWRRF